jgi:hypothetical protein
VEDKTRLTIDRFCSPSASDRSNWREAFFLFFPFSLLPRPGRWSVYAPPCKFDKNCGLAGLLPLHARTHTPSQQQRSRKPGTDSPADARQPSAVSGLTVLEKERRLGRRSESLGFPRQDGAVLVSRNRTVNPSKGGGFEFAGVPPRRVSRYTGRLISAPIRKQHNTVDPVRGHKAALSSISCLQSGLLPRLVYCRHYLSSEDFLRDKTGRLPVCQVPRLHCVCATRAANSEGRDTQAAAVRITARTLPVGFKLLLVALTGRHLQPSWLLGVTR